MKTTTEVLLSNQDLFFKDLNTQVKGKRVLIPSCVGSSPTVPKIFGWHIWLANNFR